MIKDKHTVVIIGAGISGLLLGCELTRRRIDYIIIERNGSAVEPKLHYIHEDISDIVPFPLVPIDITTNIYWEGKLHTIPTIDMMNYFSFVTTRKIFQNSMKFIDGAIHRGWMPENGMGSIADSLMNANASKPFYDWKATSIDMAAHRLFVERKGQAEMQIQYDYLVSTVPLPVLMSVVRSENQSGVFLSEPLKMTEITSATDDLFGEDIFQIIYIPKAEFGYSRISILGQRVVAEKANGEFEATEGENRIGLKRLLGLLLPNADMRSMKFDDVTNQMGRYIPVAEAFRMEIMRELQRKQVYCLGRYAEWKYRRLDHVARRVVELADTFKEPIP